MARNTFTLDGVPLTDSAGRWFPERGTGLRIIPGKRMANISYPGWDGDAFMRGATLTPGGVMVKMYVEGNDHQDFMQNLEFIIGLFMQRHKLLDLVHHYNVAGTANRVAKVKFIAGTAPKMITPTQAIVEFIGEIPDGIWRGDTLITTTVATITNNTVYANVTGFAGSTAPMGDMLIRFEGAFTNVTIGDAGTEDQLFCSVGLTSSEYLLIDTKLWRAEKFSTATWIMGGGVPVELSITSSRGFGPWFMLHPVMDSGILTYRMRTRSTSPSSSPIVEIRNYKEYL